MAEAPIQHESVSAQIVFGDPRAPARFWAKIKIDENGCWLWTAAKANFGYGAFKDQKDGKWKNWKAHRYCWTKLIGPVEPGLQLDHLCKVPACVNPAHLEPVTGRENNRRSNSLSAQRARRTHCPAGHEYTEENTHYYHHPRGIMRNCRACWPEANRRARARLKARKEAALASLLGN